LSSSYEVTAFTTQGNSFLAYLAGFCTNALYASPGTVVVTTTSVAENFKKIREIGASKFENLVNDIDEWFLYLVYLLPPDGKWSIDRVMLLGDAAHVVSGSSSRFGVANLSRCH